MVGLQVDSEASDSAVVQKLLRILYWPSGYIVRRTHISSMHCDQAPTPRHAEVQPGSMPRTRRVSPYL